MVARRVAEARVDPVRPLLGLLDELDAPSLQLLVGRPAVVGRQEDGSGEPLPHQLAHLIRRAVVHHRLPGDRHQDDSEVGLTRRRDGQPAEVAQLRHRDVGAHLPAELVGVEGKCLLLVVDPQLRVCDLDHRAPSLLIDWTAATVRPLGRAVFSKTARLYARRTQAGTRACSDAGGCAAR